MADRAANAAMDTALAGAGSGMAAGAGLAGAAPGLRGTASMAVEEHLAPDTGSAARPQASTAGAALPLERDAAERRDRTGTAAVAVASSVKRTVRLIVTRQDDPKSPTYTEEFEVPYRPNMNVITALMDIQRNPVNAGGAKTTPVCWESNCLEEVCGACSMVINGKPRQACSALVDKLEQPIRIAPMKTFPVIRDLVIDRGRMFAALKKVKAWIPIDGTYDLGPGPRMAEAKRQWAYELSKCMTCGVCLEACPNVNDRTSFIGPAAISQVRLFNAHPTGEMNKDERLDALMEDGGIEGCGNSQNCVRSCPKGIPLTTSIAEMNKDTTKRLFKKWLGM